MRFWSIGAVRPACSPSSLDLSERRERSRSVVTVVGELDVSSARALESRIDLLERGGAHAIVLDLRDVSFIDMAGLRALLRSQECCREHGRSFCCRIRSSGAVWRLLELVESLERAEDSSRDTLSSLLLETAPVF